MKGISIVLILSLFHFWFGCYSTKTKTFPEKNDLQSVLAKGEKLYLMNKDSSVYFFNAKTYKVNNDTLKGNGQKVINGSKQDPESFKIPVKDILQVEIEYKEELRSGVYGLSMTTYVIICVIGIVVFILIVPPDFLKW
jgi:hypothetical protein